MIYRQTPRVNTVFRAAGASSIKRQDEQDGQDKEEVRRLPSRDQSSCLVMPLSCKLLLAPLCVFPS